MTTNIVERNNSPSPVFIIRHNSSPVTSVAFLRDINGHDHLLSGTDSGDVLLWSLLTFRCVKTLQYNKSRVINLNSWSDGQFLCQHKNGVINVFNSDYSVIKTFHSSDVSYCKCHVYFDDSVKVIPKYLSVPSTKSNSHIDIIDYDRNEIISTNGVNDNAFGMCMATVFTKFHNDNYFLFIAYESGIITLFNTVFCNVSSYFTFNLINQLNCFDELITCFDYDPINNYGICGSVNDNICVWKIIVNDDSGFVIKESGKLQITNPGLLSCVIRTDGRIFATGGSDSRVRIFALKSLKRLAVIDTHKEPIECVAFSQNTINTVLCKGLMLAVASRDKTISLWSIYNK